MGIEQHQQQVKPAVAGEEQVEVALVLTPFRVGGRRIFGQEQQPVNHLQRPPRTPGIQMSYRHAHLPLMRYACLCDGWNPSRNGPLVPKGFSARTPEGEVARRIAAVGAAIDHVLGERKRQISGQLGGRVVQRERRRAVWLDREEIALEIARESETIAVRFVDANGKTAIAFYRPGGPWNTVPVLFRNPDRSWGSTNATAPGWANQPGVIAVREFDGRSLVEH